MNWLTYPHQNILTTGRLQQLDCYLVDCLCLTCHIGWCPHIWPGQVPKSYLTTCFLRWLLVPIVFEFSKKQKLR